MQHYFIVTKFRSPLTQLPVLIADVKRVSAQLPVELLLKTITMIHKKVCELYIYHQIHYTS